MNTTSLLPDYYTNYYHMFWKITSKLLDNYYQITTLLLPHYYRSITTSLLQNYYLITTSSLHHYYIRSTNYYQLLHNYYKRLANYFLCKFDLHYYVITSITTYRPLLQRPITTYYYHNYPSPAAPGRLARLKSVNLLLPLF